jgi:hypothetical protein
VDALVRIQTKYNMQMMKFLQKTKYHNVIIDRGGNHAFDTSTDAMLNDIRNGSGVSINDSVKFIRDEMSSANHNLFDNM